MISGHIREKPRDRGVHHSYLFIHLIPQQSPIGVTKVIPPLSPATQTDEKPQQNVTQLPGCETNIHLNKQRSEERPKAAQHPSWKTVPTIFSNSFRIIDREIHHSNCVSVEGDIFAKDEMPSTKRSVKKSHSTPVLYG